ncbi:uncharacterized protein MEPE_04963 [Melanopsichium pennsylvanicum]|uniref:Velvet domain-containing protein n=1 Tax=Melanopsichium pennsylvanicum TaxID=63383 RepID=A0AAJ4XPS0_9BASI|nr:uncharacterized protein MEPE_04963 [Melanopsichium pennsylvanicum]
MSIPNSDAPADRPPLLNNGDNQFQRTDATSQYSARDLPRTEAARTSPEQKQYDTDGVNMRPPPRPSSSSRESYEEGRTYGSERRDQPLSNSSRISYEQRGQQSYRGSASFMNDRHSSASEGNQPNMPNLRLLQDHYEASGLLQLRTSPSAPPPMLTGLPNHSDGNRIYMLTIRQQPQQGRLCGMGSKDKRPLDPLPILQLRVLKQDGTDDEDRHTATQKASDCPENHLADSSRFYTRNGYLRSYENSPNLILQVSLRKEDPNTRTHSESVLVEAPDALFPWTRMLEGRLVATANVARDLDGSRACFFIFPDLSIRQEGQFRLAFKLLTLGSSSLPSPDATTSAEGHVLAEALTEPFSVYSPRRFPGMTESTDLAKCLARQGIQVPVRHEGRRRQEQPDIDRRDELEFGLDPARSPSG